EPAREVGELDRIPRHPEAQRQVPFEPGDRVQEPAVRLRLRGDLDDRPVVPIRRRKRPELLHLIPAPAERLALPLRYLALSVDAVLRVPLPAVGLPRQLLVLAD